MDSDWVISNAADADHVQLLGALSNSVGQSWMFKYYWHQNNTCLSK